MASGFTDYLRRMLGWWAKSSVTPRGAISGRIRVNPRITGSIRCQSRISGSIRCEPRITGNIRINRP